MVDELRIYTLRPGAMADYLDLAEHVAVPVRGDRYGQLLGFWANEVGAANAVVNLWRHGTLETRKALRQQLEALPAWRERYLAGVRPLMLRQVVRFLDPVLPLAAPASPGPNLYEQRLFQARPGEAGALAEALAREGEPGQIAVWTSFAGPINEVVQLLAHADPAARLAHSLHGRDGVLARHAARIQEVETSLMRAAPHSPFR
ncbi:MULTISPECIES: NIPSNAP family protein [Roseomonadaceae]|uniref:NIPSNAP family protein n=1 Tax=Falsiroseomonas oleicola TaxID=2801474 RepID=A0ABS6HGQ4_9PROT|nr:NIPSNAP family protein [Roseomonas oleicola]MBU8546656.1 NIPSNAP family protein [Roseomonas oleicola]